MATSHRDHRRFLSNFIQASLSDPLLLANLRVLRIELLPVPGLFDSFLTIVRRSAKTLTELSLTGEYRGYEEVEAILDVFPRDPPGRLRNLSLAVAMLTPALIDLLALKGRFLKELFLHIEAVSVNIILLAFFMRI